MIREVLDMKDEDLHSKTELIETRCLRLHAVDGDAYDRYVQSHDGSSPYHYSAWLKAVEAAYGHQAWIILAEREGIVCGVLPFVYVKPPLGSGSLVSLPFCDVGGILGDDKAVEASLRLAGGQLAQQLGLSEAQLRTTGSLMDDDPDSETVAQAPKVSMRCELPESSEALFKSYKPKLRSQIRKAEKNGLTATVSSTPEAVKAFYPVFAANMRRLGSPTHSLEWFLALQAAYGPEMLIGLVFSGETVVGGGVVLRRGDLASIPWASTLAEYNRLAPNMLLYWTFLSYLSDNGCRVFDFGRSSLGEGTYRFKQQWGAKPYELQWDKLTPEGDIVPTTTTAPSRQARQIRAWIEWLWQRIPLALANHLGPRIRKYITL